MSDNVLKKQFKKRDVQRLRNLIQGKYGDKTREGVGYNKTQELHKEGDIWEENGRKWTIKNGIKQNITKLDGLKKLVIPPLFCPNCNKQMKKRMDGDMYRIHKKCWDCVVYFETMLRKEGLFEKYRNAIHNKNLDAFLEDYEKWANEAIDKTSQNTYFYTEEGDREKWSGGRKKSKLKKKLKESIKQLKKLKKK
tara:strand:+ start:431 stop:1012 length:582 start_codon:yes stop_codon:yes gene_type:complete